MTKILFTGGNGLLGKYFLKNIPAHYQVFPTFLTKKKYLKSSAKNINFVHLDITDKIEVYDLLSKIKPEYVVHAASLGNVDYCEKNKKEAYLVNLTGTLNVLEVAKKIGSRIIFTSTNATYKGDKPPYSEQSRQNPLDYYGKTKLMAEKAIKNLTKNYVIARLMTMYGWNSPNERSNPATWIIERLKNKLTTSVVTDIYNNFLYAGQASDAIWKIITANKYGETYNIAGKDSVSRFDFAEKTAEIFNLNKDYLSPVKQSYFKSLAPRPKNTSFNTTKMERKLKIKPLSLVRGLNLMKNEKL